MFVKSYLVSLNIVRNDRKIDFIENLKTHKNGFAARRLQGNFLILRNIMFGLTFHNPCVGGLDGHCGEPFLSARHCENKNHQALQTSFTCT